LKHEKIHQGENELVKQQILNNCWKWIDVSS